MIHAWRLLTSVNGAETVHFTDINESSIIPRQTIANNALEEALCGMKENMQLPRQRL
jgi:hypothetical protein